ncbi:hypothetical protein ACMU_02230 [Actibacterium mucosum KCTC 23349]|uniref:Flagellar export protein FliJ n=1 Tax=Actibacterium mucosum KCTC 23349 TaxID=1454373 RepID=A0A037ZNV4_9RHOB|nr:hypothetical protein [Actibacterium mucosum]KAJ57340.1 hypothetical protein ACMU_02230 [Actibacterium mucosum KCTC 23349]
MTKARNLKRLTMVTETGMNAALLDLRAAVDARGAIDEHIAELDQMRLSILSDPVSEAILSGADQRWLVWAEQERRHLNAALARARVAEARAKTAAAKAFGRHQAMQLVVEKRLRR